MSTPRKSAAIAALFTATLTLAGCAFGGRSLTIVHLSTGQEAHIGARSCYREVVLRTDDRTGTFVTMYSDRYDRLFTRTIGYDGRVLHTRPVVGLPKEYASFYHMQQGYALGPNGDSMAYLDEGSGELRILDLRSGESRTIATNVARTAVYVKTLRWLSADELLVAVTSGGPGADVTVLGTSQGTTRLRLPLPGLWLPLGIQTDGRYLSFQDDSCRPFSIVVHDLHEHRDLGKIVPATGCHLLTTRWADTGEARLFYVQSGPSQSIQSLREYDPSTAATKKLRQWDSAGHVFISGCFGTKLFYKLEPPCPPTKEPPDARLFVLDTASGAETEISGVRTRGRITLVDRGERIIYEYWP